MLTKSITFMLLCVLSVARVMAGQFGGKAEPLRIVFGRGHSSATYTGSVRRSEEMEYVCAARKNQRLMLQLRSLPRSGATYLQVKGPDLSFIKLKPEGRQSWSASLPETGDYLITVLRSNGDARSAAKYALIVMIK